MKKQKTAREGYEDVIGEEDLSALLYLSNDEIAEIFSCSIHTAAFAKAKAKAEAEEQKAKAKAEEAKAKAEVEGTKAKAREAEANARAEEAKTERVKAEIQKAQSQLNSVGANPPQSGILNAGLTSSIAAFRAAYRAKTSDVIVFSHEISGAFFVKADRDGNFRFVLRNEYLRIWVECEARLAAVRKSLRRKDDSKAQLVIKSITGSSRKSKSANQTSVAFPSQTAVVGTSGIGKSASRLLYITMWLEDETLLDFHSVVFNFNENFYQVHKDGNVFQINIQSIIGTRALFLLDPCKFLNNAQYLDCQMLMIFTSPSFLMAGQANEVNVKKVTEFCKIIILTAPEETIVRKMFKDMDEDQFLRFSWVEGETRYGVPQWLTYSDAEVPRKLEDCMSIPSQAGLRNWFVTNRDENSKDPNMPFPLCTVAEGPVKGSWSFNGFISEDVEKYVFHSVFDSELREQQKVGKVGNLLGKSSLFGGGLGKFSNIGSSST